MQYDGWTQATNYFHFETMMGSELMKSSHRANACSHIVRTLCTALPAGFVVMSVQPTMAQSAEPPRHHELALEEIVVTAQKRQESVQDVAASVTAISAQTVENYGINNLKDYLSLVPGLTSNGASTSVNRGLAPVGLRGVQSINGTFVGGQNTVGFYVNNTPVPFVDPRLLDVQRIEVLRGPQGTLYGSSSLGGTIKIISKQPNPEALEGKARVQLRDTKGADLSYGTDMMLNVPISETAAVRAVGYYDSSAGYLDFVGIDSTGVPTGVTARGVDDEKSYGGRIALTFSPTDSVTITPSISYAKRELDTPPWFMPSQGLVQRQYALQPAEDDYLLGDLFIEWDLGGVQLESTTAYFRSNNTITPDFTDSFSALMAGRPILPSVQTNDNEEFTHETRLLSQWEGNFQMVAGVFYTNRKEVSSTMLPAQGRPDILGFPIPNDTLFSNRSPRDRREIAVFAEASYAFSEQWKFVGGLRWFDFDFKTLDDFVGPSLLVENQRVLQRGAAKEDGVVPRMRLEFRPADNTLLYASAAKGFRMGGANFPLPQTSGCNAALTGFFGRPTNPSNFESDSLWSYEIGAKTTLADRRVTLNGAVYFVDWDNTQVRINLSRGLCPFSGGSTNVGAVESKGGELELQAAVTDRWLLSLAGSYTDTTVTQGLSFPGASIVLARKGDELPNIPKWTVSLMTEITFPITSVVEGFVRADYRYQDDRLAALANVSRKDAYSLGNVRVGFVHDDWEVSAFVENVSNARPSLLGSPALNTVQGLGVDETLRPRTVGLTVTKSF